MTATQAKALMGYYQAHAKEMEAQKRAEKARERAQKIGKSALEVGALRWLGSNSFVAGPRRWFYVPSSFFFAPQVRPDVRVCDQGRGVVMYCCPAGARIGYIEDPRM